MIHVVDDLRRELTLARVPQRIVSLVPSLTEYLISLGLARHIVGRTEFCVAPAAAVAAIPTVRGTKNPDRAAISALQPDMVIASKEENRAVDVEALTSAGIPVYVTDIVTVDGACATLTNLAALCAVAAAAQPLLRAIERQRAVEPARQVRVAAAIWRDPWMLVGADTYAADLLRVCGGVNVAAALPGRYPRVTLPELAALQPEVLLLPDEPYPFSAVDLPALAELRCQVYLCDGTLLTWYGPRLPLALRTWRTLLHSDAA